MTWICIRSIVLYNKTINDISSGGTEAIWLKFSLKSRLTDKLVLITFLHCLKRQLLNHHAYTYS